MDALTFSPQPFNNVAMTGGCGCAACMQSETEPLDDEYDALDDEVAANTIRQRCTGVPAEVIDCFDHPKTERKLCKPGHVDPCPAIPELWKSPTIGQVPFFYGAKVAKVAGTGGRRYQVVRAGGAYHVKLVPRAWTAALEWITLMAGFGMPLEAVLTAGAGPYCRCVKKPRSCRKQPETCLGTHPSNHGAGDAIDVTGVIWKAPQAVGSSLRGTLMHSWKDSAEQAPLLVRINAALRLAFASVIDYADPNHRDHFHVDTNLGTPHELFWHTERRFVAGCLLRLGFASSFSEKVQNAELLRGLAGFAQRVDMPVPTATRDLEPWRPIVRRLYGCVAVGSPTACRQA